jgi:hypothetical protein
MKSQVIFLLFGLLFFGACISHDNKITPESVTNPITADGTSDMGSLPVFQFNEEEHDFGKLTEGEKVTYTFKFKNTGKSDLVISNASASCGCTVAEYPKTPVKPGATDGIVVTFNTEGKKGIQHKTITIVANTQPSTKVLTVKAEIISIN